MGLSKTLKNLNKGSLLSNRFFDTIKLVNKNFMQTSDKDVEILPILKEAKLRQKPFHPLTEKTLGKTPYVAPLDRKTFA